MFIPEGYHHMATSEGRQFGSNKGSVFHNKTADDYLINVGDLWLGPFTRVQLELVVHVTTDVLDMTKG